MSKSPGHATENATARGNVCSRTGERLRSVDNGLREAGPYRLGFRPTRYRTMTDESGTVTDGRGRTVDSVAILETEVRELIRRRGMDPVRDRPGVVALVADVIADYDERSVVGAVPPLVDAVAAHKAVLDAVAGLGPLQRYLDDPEVEEIWINSPTEVFVARRGEPELTTTILTDAQVRDLVEQMLKVSGRRLDLSSPFVDASLPGGERLHAVIPDVTRRHWSVNIRKYVVRATNLDDLVALGSITPHAAAFLHAAVRAGLNVLVSGRHPGGQDDDAQRTGGRDPGARADHHVRRGLRAAARRARLGGHAVPPAEPRGHRRDPPAPAGQGGAAHAAEPAARRRGARGGGARPADRAQRGRAGDGDHPRELGPRGA